MHFGRFDKGKATGISCHSFSVAAGKPGNVTHFAKPFGILRYKAHGDDNYSIYISPRGTYTDPLINMAIIHSDGNRDQSFISTSDLKAVYSYTASPSHYIIEMFLHGNALTGLAQTSHDTLGLQIDVIDYDTYPGWPHYQAFTQFIDMINYLCGDANGNGLLNIQDITYLINFLYKMGPDPDPLKAGDPNGNSIVNIQDITYLINFLYKGGPAPICP
jgi:Dockerin type I domain